MPTQAERRKTTQLAILESAYAAFSDKGSPDVSLEEIARAAGVTKGTIHYHFENRTGLLVGVAGWILVQMEGRISEAADASEQPFTADDFVRAVLTEQATPTGRLMFTIADELQRIDKLEGADPHLYLATRLEDLGAAGDVTVTAAATIYFARQLAFGVTKSKEIDRIVASLRM